MSSLSLFKPFFALKSWKIISDKYGQERGSMKNAASSEIWKKLMVLGDKQGSIRLEDLSTEMGLGDEETLSFLRQIFPAGAGVEVYHKDGECWVDIQGEAMQYMLPLSPAEWVALHQVLSSHESNSPVVDSLKKKVLSNGPIKVVMELLSQLERWDCELSDVQQVMVKEIEEIILDKKLLVLNTADGKNYSLFPCKILHLEGQLSLVAEDTQDHCLSIITMKEITSFEGVTTTSYPRVMPFEIEEFITAIRAMNDRETRLILKIHDPQSTNLFPDHHFLGKPCMVTNPEGDLIWAAYVEPCEALYDWLMTLGKKVEILDPVTFRQEYLDYCEEKLRKIA
jgi:hypothetical protein